MWRNWRWQDIYRWWPWWRPWRLTRWLRWLDWNIPSIVGRMTKDRGWRRRHPVNPIHTLMYLGEGNNTIAGTRGEESVFTDNQNEQYKSLHDGRHPRCFPGSDCLLQVLA
ncbi:hypothetical protein CRG98_047465 [Punica granatum]|uniref:Uncharacterized protein n=1 Tax=Punica granatum TaxID=22663 RepID=A0A2I0HK91_PUNGR|nr:hypothetical protein CRG98_047465 [Punica granatum]